MRQFAYTLVLDRDKLPDLLAFGASSRLEKTFTEEIDRLGIKPRQLIAGYWALPAGDPTPDFLITRDSDYEDTQAWLSAFLGGASPISQWCRVWMISAFLGLGKASSRPALGSTSGGWIGAVLAELSSQHIGLSLKDVPGASALTCASFCAARACAIWPDFDRFEELVERHDALFGKAESKARGPASSFIPLWYILSANKQAPDHYFGSDSFLPLKYAVNQLSDSWNILPERLAKVANLVGQEYRLSALERCAIGPQRQRVEALDRLAVEVTNRGDAETSSAILGFAASLVDPGVIVTPALLGGIAKKFPSAAVWAGAFAGLQSGGRALSDHGGLGHIIQKEILSPSDLFCKPLADIDFDELLRWTGGSFDSRRISIRGLMSRSISVELLPGITVPLPVSRNESRAQDAIQSSKHRQGDLSFDENKSFSHKQSRGDAPSLESEVEPLETRVTRLENIVGELAMKFERAGKAPTRARGASK